MTLYFNLGYDANSIKQRESNTMSNTMSTITARIEEINPEKARLMLENNTENFRPLNANTVAGYVKSMLRGEWELNGSTIIFHENGILLDGQHRLKAAVLSGVTIKTVIVRGVKVNAFHIDKGKNRNLAQWLQYEGYHNAANLAATSRSIVVQKKGFWSDIPGKGSKCLDIEALNLVYENNTRLQHAINQANRVVGLTIPPSTLASIYYIATESGDAQVIDVADWFIDRLAKRDELSGRDPVYALIRILQNQTPTKQITPLLKKALVTIAWNKTLAGESVKSLRIRLTGPKKQPYPEIAISIQEAQP